MPARWMDTHTQCSDRRSRDEQAKDREEHKRLLLCDAVIDLAKCVGVAYIGEPSIYTRVKPPKMSKGGELKAGSRADGNDQTVRCKSNDIIIIIIKGKPGALAYYRRECAQPTQSLNLLIRRSQPEPMIEPEQWAGQKGGRR